VDKLQVDAGLMGYLSLALCRNVNGPGSSMGILPELRTLARPDYAHFGDAFDGFIAARRSMGRHVTKCRRPRITDESDGEDEEEAEPDIGVEEEESNDADPDMELDDSGINDVLDAPLSLIPAPTSKLNLQLTQSIRVSASLLYLLSFQRHSRVAY
jgi:hypothetical protein